LNDKVSEMLGVSNAMDNFTGRKEKMPGLVNKQD
jgi:hypothetical protein